MKNAIKLILEIMFKIYFGTLVGLALLFLLFYGIGKIYALSSMDYRSCHLNIVEYGTEYVRIDYTNKQKQQKFTVFEIVVSPYNLVVISQFDEVGNQINFSTY